MSKVVGYLWVHPSSKHANAEIEAEKQAIASYCQANRLEMGDFVVDAGTLGAALERPAMKDLIEGEPMTVIVRSLSNFGRRFHDVATVLSEFSFRSIRLVSVDENIDTTRPEGQQLLRMFVTIPQIRSCVRAPKQEAAKTFVRAREVLHNGGACPFAYSLNEKSNQFAINENEANVIKRIFRERAQGRSLRQIANDLTSDAIATKRGGRWQANTVKTILENPFYTGDYHCQGKIHQDDHEAIIDRALFNKVSCNDSILQVG
ncbi:MAG TPA: hypothetical protein DD435_10580 [Cyanobacteria bacterium UBA8530]|nr:hypothetical protein [Cyanobacteria bacterium UBA8530]